MEIVPSTESSGILVPYQARPKARLAGRRRLEAFVQRENHAYTSQETHSAHDRPTRSPGERTCRSPPTTAPHPAKPFLRFYHPSALRTSTLTVLTTVETAEDSTRHRNALSDVVLELTDHGLDYYFLAPLAVAKVGFVRSNPPHGHERHQADDRPPSSATSLGTWTSIST